MATTDINATRFAESELILDKNQRIYHLNLHPDEIANTIITVGDPDRVPLVSRHFDRIEVTRSKREFVTHTGYLSKKRISVVSTGIGTDNIDIVLHELDALVNIDFNTRQVKPQLTALTLIRIGTSGALQADIPVDSTVISEAAIGFDNLMHYYAYDKTPAEAALYQAAQQYFGELKPYIASGSPTLINHFATADTFKGLTATCSGFYGPQGRLLRSPASFPHLIKQLQAFHVGQQRITNFEMETAGIYGLANLMGHRAISISAIVANRITQAFSTQGETTVNRLIEQTLSQLTTFEAPAIATKDELAVV